MEITTIGIDVAKNVFQTHGVDRRALSRWDGQTLTNIQLAQRLKIALARTDTGSGG